MEQWKLDVYRLMNQWDYYTHFPWFEAAIRGVKILANSNAEAVELKSILEQHIEDLTNDFRCVVNDNTNDGGIDFVLKTEHEYGQCELHRNLTQLHADVEDHLASQVSGSDDKIQKRINTSNTVTLLAIGALVLAALIVMFVWKPKR